MIPPEGLGFFEAHGAPEHVVLTNRHHDRDAWQLREAFGCTVLCVRNGLHELEGRGPAEPFDFGEELPGGIHVHEVDAICPDETALYVPRHRALAVADGVVRWRGGDALQFVPDSLMDDPEHTRQQLREAYRRLLELDFEMLLAHGDPITAGAREALGEFVSGAG
jgi:glyoxylase-like metal-dependent hydrolase (beta-lactamase superfamily II)